jgi:hypothetical protein
MFVDDQYAEIGEPIVPRRRQREPVTDALSPFVRPCQHVEFEREIGGAARHGANHC